MATDDREYYRIRAQRERDLAKHSPDPAVATTHLNMAKEYERRAQHTISGLRRAREA